MKKAIIILLFSCFLSSCVVQGDNSINKSEGESMGNKGESIENKTTYKEGIYTNKNWDVIEFPIEQDCIQDKETAIIAAEIFLLIERLQDEAQNLSFRPTEVFYDTEDMIWIVSFSPFQNGMLIPGDSYNIALRKNNAEVLKMWVE